MLKQSVKLFLCKIMKIVEVIAPNMAEILSILLEETDKFFIFSDRLSG